MTKRILFVDDEPNVLQAFQRQFHGRFEVSTAQGPERGLQQLAAAEFAVVVSDLRMPAMDGVEFLRRVHDRWPGTVRMMLTGQGDLSAAIAAVNLGNIFQFLTKPCPPDVLRRSLEGALEQHRLLHMEKELLEQTLRGAVGVMSEILSLSNPAAYSRAERIRRYVKHIAVQLKLADQWQFELAAMLSQIGCVTVPEEVLQKSSGGKPLDLNEQEALAQQSGVGKKLLAQIPRLEDVAEMVGHQRGLPDRPVLSPVARKGAEILRTALDFDDMVMRGTPTGVALQRMRERGGYSVDYLTALTELEISQAKDEVRQLRLSDLKAGMITNANVYSKSGLLILAMGQEITSSALVRLLTFGATMGIIEPISVLARSTQNLDAEEIITR